MPKMLPKSLCKYNHKSIRERSWKTKHNPASLSNNVLVHKLKRLEEQEMTKGIVVAASKKIQPYSFPKTLLLSLV